MRSHFIRSALRKTAVFITVCAIVASHASLADAKPRRLRNTANNRYASIIMDAQTGRVLESTNPDKKLYPASVTKLMTLFLTFESIQRGRLSMNKTLTISTNATRQPPTKMGVRPGDTFTVKQGILSLITRSANDVAVVMAENIAGSEEAFAKMMNARARSLGMANTHFMNPSGLPNGAQMTTVRDIAILSRALMQYFPNQYPLFSTRSFVYKREVITNHNHLMESYEGMDGLKTGFINASGFNLAASAVRNNRRLIVVVFGGKSAASRDAHVADLFNQGFAMLSRDQQKTQVASAAPKVTTPSYTPPQTIEPIQADTTTPIADPVSAPVATPTQTPPAVIQPVEIASAAPVRTTTPTQVIKPTPQPKPIATTASASAAKANGWVPDGGQVRTLQLPSDYTGPHPTQQIQPVASVAQATQAAAPGVLPTSQPAQYRRSSEASDGWGIQVGASTDVAAGQQALQLAQRQLGGLPASARGVIVPSVTPTGTIYRARILGLSSQAANQACSRLNDCMIFAVR